MKYSLGLDIGTTSIGWAVIDEDKKRIHDVGVRIFEKPEDPKTGKSISEPRRTARSTRRRLKRRRQRLNALKQFFVVHNLLTRDTIEQLLSPSHHSNPYEIRSRGLTSKLSNEELFIALYSIAKRRGYKSNRKSLEEKDSEGSRVLAAISANKEILANYGSVANALNNSDKFSRNKRNKRDSYVNSFARQDFLDEARAIVSAQKSLGLDLADSAVDTLLFADEDQGDFTGIFSQRPFMTSELIAKMRGTCEFEADLPRAPRASYSFEIFRLAQNLSHLRIVIEGETRSLTQDEIAAVVEKAKTIKTLKYSHIREVLGHKNNSSFKFAQGMIRGKIKDNDKSDGEDNKFDELKFYYSVMTALKNSPSDRAKVLDDSSLLDSIGEILTLNKDDSSLRKGLAELGLSDSALVELLKLNFSGFGHLSIKALKSITPHILTGLNYDQAVTAAGYKFSQKLSGDKTKLPPFSALHSNQVTNPIAKRAISQAIKVINAVIFKYGLPYKIKVEAANDLAKTFADRQKIKRSQEDNADYNEALKTQLQEEFGVINPTGLQITKLKLYKQQHGKCIYSGKPLSLSQLFSDERYGEIDHIIPFSRCGNDSLTNKVLVLTGENQQKANLTPYEAWGSDTARWAQFEALVRTTYKPYESKVKKSGARDTKEPKMHRKAERLLATGLPNEEWNKRAINDTRYISKFLHRYIADNLQFADAAENDSIKRVITPSGPITSYLRRIWRVGSKNRDDNNLHHAVDACIIAAIDYGTIQKVSRLNKYYELFKGNKDDEVTDRRTGEILKRRDLEQHSEEVEPWEDFGKEVRKRTALYKNPSHLHNELEGLANYDVEFRTSLNPIFVSRMPKRGGKGAASKETVRSPKVVEDYENDKGEKVTARKQRVPLTTVNLKALYDSPVRQDAKLYEVLKNRLEEHGDNPQKAFAADNPIYKPTKDGSRGNIVRSIKVYDTQNSKTGYYINGGKAFVNNGSMVRLDVYSKQNAKGKVEHFFVPVYTHQIPLEKRGEKITKILPAPKGFTDIDETFTKVTALFPNDYVRVYFGNKITEGYYVKYGSASGQMLLISHTSSSKDIGQLITCSARSAVSIERLDISVLGDNYPWS